MSSEESDLISIIQIYRSIKILKELPKPLGISIPENVSPSEYKKYATEFPAYSESIDDLKEEALVDRDRKIIMLTMFAYLYNTKTFDPLENESITDFFIRCQDRVEDTLILFKDKATDKGLSLFSYVNEIQF